MAFSIWFYNIKNVLALHFGPPTKMTMSWGSGQIALLSPVLGSKIPFEKGFFWKTLFPLEIPLSALFGPTWPFCWTNNQFYACCLYDSCPKSDWQLFNNILPIFFIFLPLNLAVQSHVLFPSILRVIWLDKPQAWYRLLWKWYYCQIILHFWLLKLSATLKNSFKSCFCRPVLSLKCPFFEKYFGPFALF